MYYLHLLTDVVVHVISHGAVLQVEQTDETPKAHGRLALLTELKQR